MNVPITQDMHFHATNDFDQSGARFAVNISGSSFTSWMPKSQNRNRNDLKTRSNFKLQTASEIVKRRPLQKSEGNFFVCGGFFGGFFFGPFPWRKQEKSTPKSTAKFKSEFGSFAAKIGALRKGPPFHGSRSSREIKIQNASCQMGGREVTR